MNGQLPGLGPGYGGRFGFGHGFGPDYGHFGPGFGHHGEFGTLEWAMFAVLVAGFEERPSSKGVRQEACSIVRRQPSTSLNGAWHR